MKELIRALRPVKNRLRFGRMLRGAAAGFAAGGAAALILMAVSVFVPLQNRWILAAAAAGGCVLLGAAVNALRPVKDAEAARAADGCGLQERAVTALEAAGKAIPEGKAAGMLEAQKRDALEHLRALDAKKIPVRVSRRWLVCGAALLALCAAVSLIRGDGVRQAEARKLLGEKTAAMAEEIDTAEAKDEEGKSEAEKAELRKLTADLKRELLESRDEVDAMVALDKAEQRLEQMRQKTAGDAAQALADALRGAGMDQAADAMEGGDARSLAEALQGRDGEALREAAEGLEGDARELAEQIAEAMEKGEAAQAQMQAAMNAAQAAQAQAQQGAQQPSGQQASSAQASASQGSSGMKGALQQALAGMKASLGGGTAQQPGQNMSGASGSGAGNKGQNGGGAGTGSTNEEQKGGGKAQQGTSGGGDRPPEYKEEKFESIYDPEKAETATRDVMTEQNRTGEDSVQIEAGPGKGTLEGNVPFRQVIGEYAEAEAQAAESARLTQEQKQWVDEYFRKLTDE